VADPPSAETLKDLLQAFGACPVTKLFNTTGDSYRTGNFKAKLMGMSEARRWPPGQGRQADQRPILDTGRTVVVGFDEKAYTASTRPKK